MYWKGNCRKGDVKIPVFWGTRDETPFQDAVSIGFCLIFFIRVFYLFLVNVMVIEIIMVFPCFILPWLNSPNGKMGLENVSVCVQDILI